MFNKFDVIVVGAGHAGCEAAHAAAKMGSKVLLVTMDLFKVAQMSCNPAVGGIAKGQIVREIDALGGYMGIVTDASTIQYRMLNKSKGPAMWSPRAQCDRISFSMNWRYVLEHTNNLNLWQDEVVELIFEGNSVIGVKTSLGAVFHAHSVILTSGTFLNGKLFIGSNSTIGGRIGEPSSLFLSDQLRSKGILVDRMKTGTPARIDIRSIDISDLFVQFGDKKPDKFSYLDTPSSIQTGVDQMKCYITHTDLTVHNILRDGFSKSPLFNGLIHGRGPRYCPSIEDKLRIFPDKASHQLFLEPEGWNTNEYYLQGFSSSLPLDIQYKAIRAIKGFKNAVIYRPGYAVEYDYFPPTQLFHTLEVKSISNLYFAGQINGTTGYEEAAAQGLIAGINAHLKIIGKEPFILRRDQAYIGVLIDDLVTKGVDEPYRMFTSRAEFRTLLRQDNADLRLTELSFNLGLASKVRYESFKYKYSKISKFSSFLNNTLISAESINPIVYLNSSNNLTQNKSIYELLSRPYLDLETLLLMVPRGTLMNFFGDLFCEKLNLSSVNNVDHYDDSNQNFKNIDELIFSLFNNIDSNLQFFFNEFELPFNKPHTFSRALLFHNFLLNIITTTEISVKYRGYIEREKKLADKILRLENLNIPNDFDYSVLNSISIESRQKLEAIRPKTISQASRIPGVSPADISVLLVYFGR